MHADACYPHRRGSRSPSEVHEHTEDGPMPGHADDGPPSPQARSPSEVHDTRTCMVSAAATSQSVSPMDPIEKKGSQSRPPVELKPQRCRLAMHSFRSQKRCCPPKGDEQAV